MYADMEVLGVFKDPWHAFLTASIQRARAWCLPCKMPHAVFAVLQYFLVYELLFTACRMINKYCFTLGLLCFDMVFVICAFVL